ncbi:MAG: hypothetical protein HYX41_02505 [Bdellovibrio sp.]|nr:hypothetical protein [Bdellovibrio sp.]
MKRQTILGPFGVLTILLQGIPALAALHLSDMPAGEGLSEPRWESHSEQSSDLAPPGLNSFQTFLNPTEFPLGKPIEKPSDKLGGFDELTPYVFASPDQQDAGSCLYMAITGIAEWWLARLNPHVPRNADGQLDLSERFIMNFAGFEENETGLKNWRTDAIYLFSRNRNQSLRNSTYRYTKGWYTGETYSDHLVPAKPNAPGAEYGTSYNWIDERPSQTEATVPLPEFDRTVIFADPAENQWNVGVAPHDIADQVKFALRTRKSPVLVIYNHNSYWHAVFIVGYNDEMSNGNCAYTERFRKVILERADELAKKAAEAKDPVAKKAYEIRAKRAREAKIKIEDAYAKNGGCSSDKGVFYIRDSIYPDEGGPLYHYNLSVKDDVAPYSKKIVFKEYDWLKYFANHISIIYPQDRKSP